MSADLMSPDTVPGMNGGRRVNNLPIVIFGAIILIFISIFFYVAYGRSQQNAIANADGEQEQTSQQSGRKNNVNLALNEILEAAPKSGFVGVTEDKPAPAAAAPAIPKPAPQYSYQPPQAQTVPVISQAEMQLIQRKRQMLEDALYGGTSVQFATQQHQQPSNMAPGMGMNGYGAPATPGNNGSMMLAGMNNPAAAPAEIPARAQDDFVLKSDRVMPQSPYEIKAGAIIPAMMINGINSDLPGMVTAQVSQNVWDSISGTSLLIPQGSRLVGRYSSQVDYGQRRVMLAWDRLIYPDGSSVALQGMEGADQSGFSGFNDQVDNHYMRVFGSAFLMSMISAGVATSQDNNNNNNDNNDKSYSSELSSAAGQQIANVSEKMISKNLDIAPTLTIRPGYRFNVMVNRDMVFERPYQYL
ncbi:TrbI/VirB10 family protein [Kistimonas asteriae]|uniref:TrbI/VirB10 family protein n=1 Tax=Kistimonas asteriae TaxID=517724 RepID=UPI001FECC9B5|nr:TrbI/VirB10 family protein [Kistimonas asteriae]